MKINGYLYLMFCFIAMTLKSCLPLSATPLIEIPNIAPPTAPVTFPEILGVLKNGSAEGRISTASKVLTLSEKEKELAVPYLINNLDYKENSDVRRTAAIVLGEIGPKANQSVDRLVSLLNNDDATIVKIAAAEALGKIGDQSVVPNLVNYLNSSDLELAIVSAKSIALLTGQSFTDLDSQNGYSLDSAGEPYIVIDAKRWWEDEGKYQDW